MITRLRVQNYRCLRDVEMTLEPLTVFVGANASGKSSALRAVVPPRQIDTADAYRAESVNNLVVDVTMSAASGSWRPGVGNDLVRGIQRTGQYPPGQLLHFDLGHLREAVPLNEAKTIESTGRGLANVFATLARPQQDELARRFCALVPMFADVHPRPKSAGLHRMVFQDRWTEGTWYEPEQVSDGSMLMLAYLLLQYQDPPPDVIAIEEPERGLHPFLLGKLVETLRNMAEGKLGKQIQVVLATHSAELLEFVRPEEVRFFSRDKTTGETKVEAAPTDSTNWAKVFREYDDSLRGLWLSGGLGGVP
ncbi:MAG: AAA family ATPase [Planctomycetota bacterium]